MPNKNTTIAKNTFFLTIRMVFVLIVSLYTSRVFLNVLGVVDYGISNVVAGFVSMFGFLNLSLANGTQRFYNSEMGRIGPEGITKVFNTSLVIQFIIALCVLILLETVGLWYLYEKMVIPEERFEIAIWIYHFSVLSAAIVIMQTPFSAAIMSYEKMNAYAVISILDVVLKLAFALVLPYISIDRLLMFGAFHLCVTILNFLLNFIYSKNNFRELRFERVYSRKMFKEMISFSGWNLFGTFACMGREQGLNLVLNYFFGPIVNAAQGIAYQVSGAMQGFVQNLSLAAKPQMIQSFATGESSRTMRLMYTMSKLSFISLFIIAVPIMLNINYILHLWLGDVVPIHTAAFVILILFAMFMNNLNAPLSNVVYATGKMRNYQVTFSVINLLIIPFSYFALKAGAPPEAAFLIYFIMTIVVQCACLIVLKSLVSLSLSNYILKLIFPLIAVAFLTTPFICLIYFLLGEGLIGLIIEYILIIPIASYSLFFMALDKREKEIVKSITTKIKDKIQ